MEIVKFTKRPVTIEAVRWDGTPDMADQIIEWADAFGCEIAWSAVNERLYVTTLEGVMGADIRDFIIKGVNDEFYPCKPDIFKKTYYEAGTEMPEGEGWVPFGTHVDCVKFGVPLEIGPDGPDGTPDWERVKPDAVQPIPPATDNYFGEAD